MRKIILAIGGILVLLAISMSPAQGHDPALHTTTTIDTTDMYLFPMHVDPVFYGDDTLPMTGVPLVYVFVIGAGLIITGALLLGIDDE